MRRPSGSAVAIAASGALAVALSLPLVSSVAAQQLGDPGAATTASALPLPPPPTYGPVVPAGAGGEAVRPTAPATVPTRLVAPDIQLDAEVYDYTDEMVQRQDGVNPDDLDRVAWWSGGGSPHRWADNTVYLYGHTWWRPAVFNDIGRLQPGQPVEVHTDHGVVRYEVTGAFVVAKEGLGSDSRVTARVPGQLLLIGCFREGEERYTTENIVVVARVVA